MDESTFTELTAVTLGDSDSVRFATILDVATKALERQLGYPLDPSDWANLYNELGKTQDECICPDVVTDDTDLEAADAVVGKYRLYDWYSTDRYLPIDPATAIHAVKLVNDSVTYKTFDPEDYMVKWDNWQDSVTVGQVTTKPTTTRYLDVSECGWKRWPDCWQTNGPLQLAVDATWAWNTLPTELNVVLADLIKDGLAGRDSTDIQSESRGSHSYSKFDKESQSEKYPVLAELAGPNGLAKPPRPV